MKKNIVIAILLIAIVIMGGTFYYLFTNQDKIFDKCNCPKTSPSTQTENEKETNEADKKNNTFGSLVGTYKYEETFKQENQMECTDKIELELKEDGTYKYENSSNCGGGTTAEGTYSISKDKIVLINNNCKPAITDLNKNTCEYQNCTPIIELDYKNNKISVPRVYQGVIVELQKN